MMFVGFEDERSGHKPRNVSRVLTLRKGYQESCPIAWWELGSTQQTRWALGDRVWEGGCAVLLGLLQFLQQQALSNSPSVPRQRALPLNSLLYLLMPPFWTQPHHFEEFVCSGSTCPRGHYFQDYKTHKPLSRGLIGHSNSGNRQPFY